MQCPVSFLIKHFPLGCNPRVSLACDLLLKRLWRKIITRSTWTHCGAQSLIQACNISITAANVTLIMLSVERENGFKVAFTTRAWLSSMHRVHWHWLGLRLFCQLFCLFYLWLAVTTGGCEAWAVIWSNLIECSGGPFSPSAVSLAYSACVVLCAYVFAGTQHREAASPCLNSTDWPRRTCTCAANGSRAT